MTNSVASGTAETLDHPARHRDVLRRDVGFKADAKQWLFDNSQLFLAFLRRFLPLLKVGPICVVTRYDDVKEVFLADDAFPVSYSAKLKVVTGETPFIFGMEDGPDYRRDITALRKGVLDEDIPTRLAAATTRSAEQHLDTSGRCIEVVDFVRTVTFEVLLDYFGVPKPGNPQDDIQVWATRLFQYICYVGKNADFDNEAKEYGEKLRAHVRQVIAARKASGEYSDDILGRSLRRQAAGEAGFSDEKICASLVGFIVAGLPQPPAVLPKVLEQLLRRSNILAEAQRAAEAHDEETLRRYAWEAMRFDPLTPILPRNTKRERVLAAGTLRAKQIEPGTHVLFSFASAMMDGRRVPDPQRFNPNRPISAYMLFGHGLHECFFKRVNDSLLPLMLMSLLRRGQVVRAKGGKGHLRKVDAFADRLVICFEERRPALHD
jgi:cytochrome P450